MSPAWWSAFDEVLSWDAWHVARGVLADRSKIDLIFCEAQLVGAPWRTSEP